MPGPPEKTPAKGIQEVDLNILFHVVSTQASVFSLNITLFQPKPVYFPSKLPYFCQALSSSVWTVGSLRSG